MKKILILLILGIAVYYFIPKSIESCGSLHGGTSCTVGKCERGFPMNGVGKLICFLGGEPVLK